jgi:hypothetical protein
VVAMQHRVGGWDGWMGGLQKLTTVLGRFDTYKGVVWIEAHGAKKIYYYFDVFTIRFKKEMFLIHFYDII